MSEKRSRREFLGRSAAAVGLAAAGAEGFGVRPAAAQEPLPASKVPVMALIGCGGMGRANMNNFIGKRIPIAAVCDVDESHLKATAEDVYKKQGKRPEEFKDFRKLLERKDIDAVIIGTPDHWHALPHIYACQAGKDIYLEKPISHNITEGRAMVAAARRNKTIVQVGTWQRSTGAFVDAVNYIRSGKLGRITTARAWKTDEFRMGKNSPKNPPASLDWDFWTGPAQLQPFTGKNGHFDWRWYWNYASGMTGDWGVHMMDIAFLGMSPGTDLVMPTEVSAYGGKLAWPDDDRTTPDTHLAIMQFPGFVFQWETGRRPLDATHDNGTQFISADGTTLTVWRNDWALTDNRGKPLEKPKETTFHGPDHWQNFLDCIVSREQPRSNIESMYQTTTICQLANAALLAGAPVKWDKEKDDIVGKTGKDTLPYRREYRKPWSLPKIG